MNRVLVTGATGFVGRHVVRTLRERGVSVRAHARSAACDGLGVEAVRGDVSTDDGSLDTACADCDVVIHCAGAVGDKVTWESGRAVNEGGTRRVVLAAQRAKVRRLVHVSTLGVYGVEPGTYREDAPRRRVNEPYTDTKIGSEELAEQLCSSGPTSLRIVRPGMIYGPNDTGMIPHLAQMLQQRVPMIGRGDSSVSLVHVHDVVDAILGVAQDESEDRIFNVRGPDDLTWAELVEMMTAALHLPKPRHMPKPIASMLALGMEALAALRILSRAPLTRFVVKLLTSQRNYPIDRIRDGVGIVPRVSVSAGIPAALSELGHQGTTVSGP